MKRINNFAILFAQYAIARIHKVNISKARILEILEGTTPAEKDIFMDILRREKLPRELMDPFVEELVALAWGRIVPPPPSA